MMVCKSTKVHMVCSFSRKRIVLYNLRVGEEIGGSIMKPDKTLLWTLVYDAE